MTKEQFEKGVKNFDSEEPFRAKLYHPAVKLFDKGDRLEACILILATWNMRRFGKYTNSFVLDEFEADLGTLDKLLEPLKNETLGTVNLDNHKTEIEAAFNLLNDREGVEATGASKVLHLFNRQIFVMWDGYIRGEKAQRHYDGLDGYDDYPVVQHYEEGRKKYKREASDYFMFLHNCRNYVDYEIMSTTKTLAKQIDEVHYYYITKAIQRVEKAESNVKKEAKKANKEKR